MKQIVILCGGLGSRLESQEQNLPKALHEINGKTILEWQIASLGKTKFEILLLIGLEDNYEKFLGIATSLEVQYGHTILLLTENTRAGTAGALKSIESKLGKKFIVLLGDILFDAPVTRLLDTLDRRVLISVWVRETDHPVDSDLVELSPDGKFSNFSKYPHKDLKILNNSFGLTGIYAMRKRFVRSIPESVFIDIPEHLDSLSKKQLKNCRGVVSLHSFRDIGTKERFVTGGEFLSVLERKISSTLVILDRDGTLMRDPIRSKKTFARYNSKIVKKLIKLNSTRSNVVFMLATNQPAIAKGTTSLLKVRDDNKKLQDWLGSKGVHLSGIEVCPHHPEKGFEGEVQELKVECRCRKPNPGMVIDFVKRNSLNPTSIIVFGDSKFDYLLSRKLGCKFEWVRFGNPLLIARNCYSLLRTVVNEKR